MTSWPALVVDHLGADARQRLQQPRDAHARPHGIAVRPGDDVGARELARLESRTQARALLARMQCGGERLGSLFVGADRQRHAPAAAVQQPLAQALLERADLEVEVEPQMEDQLLEVVVKE